MWACGFVAPAVLILAVGHIYPILWLILLSGQETDVLRNTHEWTGLANGKTLFDDPIFWKSVKNTLVYCLWVVPGVLIISLALAFACQSMRDRSQHAMRAALYLPGVVSVVVLGMVWARICDPPFGLINQALERFGIEGPVWLGDTTWALLAINRSLGFQPGQRKEGRSLSFQQSSRPPPGDGRLNRRRIEKGRSAAHSFHFFRLKPASRPPEVDDYFWTAFVNGYFVIRHSILL